MIVFDSISAPLISFEIREDALAVVLPLCAHLHTPNLAPLGQSPEGWPCASEHLLRVARLDEIRVFDLHAVQPAEVGHRLDCCAPQCSVELRIRQYYSAHSVGFTK